MEQSIFYNGQRLINSKDINGDMPEIYAVDGNRSDGKTTFFARKMIRDFKKYGKKFMIVKRFQYQIKNAHEVMFKLVGPHWFPKDKLTAVSQFKGRYMELFLNDKPCGYVCALSMAEKLKDISQFYCDTDQMFFDEFQAKEYVPDEANMLFTLHTSAGREFGKAVKRVPVYMCCNHVSSLNPYYKMWGCGARVDEMKKGIYRGDGFVIERDFNEKVSKLQEQSAFNRAFINSSIYKHTVFNESVSDNFSFCEKIKSSKFDYICNCIIDGEYISLIRVKDVPGVHYYFSENVNKSCRCNFTVFSNDHSIDTLLLGRNVDFLNSLKNQFDHGYMRFSNLDVKEKAFQFLSIMI